MRAMTAAVVMVGLSAVCGSDHAAQAQQRGTCKDCRDFHQACVKAHSQNACKNDYEICMKHCEKR